MAVPAGWKCDQRSPGGGVVELCTLRRCWSTHSPECYFPSLENSRVGGTWTRHPSVVVVEDLNHIESLRVLGVQ